LGGVPDGADGDALASDGVENGIGSASEDQLADSRPGSCASEMRMIPESFDDGDDAGGQAFRR
jgi:hypothetical protein